MRVRPLASGILLPLALFGGAVSPLALQAQGQPTPSLAESPTIKVLTGLTVPEFEQEMHGFVQALGGNCGSCHTVGNFPSDQNPRKVIARAMIEMTKALNAQFFPDHKPGENDSRLGRVTCYTCHQGEVRPSGGPPSPAR